MASKPIVAIEIGTTQTVAILGSYSAKGDGTVEVEAICTEKTAGVRKSEVQSAQSVGTTAEGILRALSKKGRTDINRVCLVYSGGGVQGTHIKGKTEINNHDDIVEESDVDAAIDNLRGNSQISGRTTLEEIRGDFILDGSRVVEDPENLSAGELSVTGLRTHVDTNSYRAMVEAVESSLCDVGTVYSAAASSPLGCTTKDQREAGVVVINLGGGSTCWSVTRNDRITAVGHLAVGGDHVTNDILSAFHTGTEESANALKQEFAQATLDGVDPTARVQVPKLLGMPKTVNLRALCMVVNARLDETLRIVREQILEAGGLDGLGAGIVLCGGGALLRGVPQLVMQIFGGIPCILGSMPFANCPEMDDAQDNLRFAAVYGALVRAARTAHEEEEESRGGRLPSLFSIFSRGGGRK